ncbi:MAG TPA: hypothetical protein PK957_04285 [Candidatus Dojkabacteria bacterium]|nr:hypothetical protein [Candidatus Dojkabacteria bacterium]
MADGTLKTISELTITLPDGIEYYLDVTQITPENRILLVNGTYSDEDGNSVQLYPNYLYCDKEGRAIVRMAEQDADGLACKNFRNILATAGDMIHGATVTDSTQLRLGAINVALVPAVKDVSFAPLPGYDNPPNTFIPEYKSSFSSAASAITPGDITGYAQKGQRLIPLLKKSVCLE